MPFIEGGPGEEISSKDEFFEHLKKLLDYPLTDTIFEAEINEKGLNTGLENLGILPVVKPPNSPDEYEDYVERIKKRSDVLKYLVVGCILGRTYKLFSDLPRGRSSPEETSSEP